MMKMHLPARIPSEGARRLAWWVGEQCKGDLRRAASLMQIGQLTLSNLITGATVCPDDVLSIEISARTRGRIYWRDWHRPAEGGWFDAPSASAPARPVAA